MRHGEFGHLSINCDSSFEGFDKLQLLLLLYGLDQSEKTPLGGSVCELWVLFFPPIFFLSPSPCLSVWLKCFGQVIPESIYSTAHCNMLWRGWNCPGGWLQDVLVWFSAWDGQLVKWTADCEQSGLSLLTAIQYTKQFICILLARQQKKKSILQSRANVFPKMKNRAFPVNDTSVWNNAAYFPDIFFLCVSFFSMDPVQAMACELVCALIPS